MRPTTNFALHAIVAAAIAALAASGAAAQYVAGNFQLALDGDDAGLVGSADGSQVAGGRQLNVESYQWGATASGSNLGGWSKVEGLAVDFDPVAKGGSAGSEMVMKGSKIGQNSTAARPGPAVTERHSGRDPLFPFHYNSVTPRDIASGQASGKRQPAPPSPGSLRVKLKLPWAACRVGTRFPEMKLAGDGGTYRLKDAAVSSCAAGGRPMEEIAFNYAKVEY